MYILGVLGEFIFRYSLFPSFQEGFSILCYIANFVIISMQCLVIVRFWFHKLCNSSDNLIIETQNHLTLLFGSPPNHPSIVLVFEL